MRTTRNDVRFVLKDARAESETLIFLVYRFSGQRLKYSTGEKTNPKNWDNVIQRLKIDQVSKAERQNSKEANLQLDRYEAKVLELRRTFDLTSAEISPDLFKIHMDKEFKKDARLLKAPKKSETLIQFAQRFVAEAKCGDRLIRRKNIKYSSVTLKTHQTTITNLIDFQEHIGKSVDFKDIDMNFHRNFIKWLTNVKKYASNSIGNQIKHLKAWMRAALGEGLHDNISYESDEFNKPREDTTAIYLTDAELVKLYQLDLSKNKKLDSVRDLFLIGCDTGLRFSDFSQLKPDNISKDGRLLVVTTQKTSAKVYIPLKARVTAILSKYQYNIPRAISNQKMNDYLKELASAAGLDERVETTITKGGHKITKFVEKSKIVSTHTARRSFATNAYLDGVSSIDIMKITGHKTETSFMKYIKVSGEETALRMLKHNHFNKVPFTVAS